MIHINSKLTTTDLSNFDKWWSDAHFVSFLFYYYYRFCLEILSGCAIPFNIWISWALQLKSKFDNWPKRDLFFHISYKNYEQSQQKLGIFLDNKLANSSNFLLVLETQAFLYKVLSLKVFFLLYQSVKINPDLNIDK